ncbi:hypothetical protein ASG29_07195 [Sphingomonas sp. Leaf412]|uniref:DUF5694 domain-containing protein n=1 Tax=Sphingomonas sp. Leaf412 TaxID=1736370 RepID=UPI0006FC3945|nr:DUF5694 domain-containing protein [Sphingomonas sp. Leaf412]KQT31708.1 hypothetical protein ASG29_07195 [Sphingomonas sp. Leaf412]
MTLPLIAALLAAPATAQEYRPAFDPGRLKAPATMAPNEVMVLGTTHLSGLPETFDAALLGPLLDRLAAWKPTAVATENVSGLQCDMLRRYPSRYAGTVETYCGDPSAAAKATGLDVPAANAEAERLLTAWPADPTAAQRRRLAAVFLAAGERGSALVQWLRLAPAERRAGDGVDAALVAELERYRQKRNETSWIAAPLAARLGLERLWAVDDHSADSPEKDEAAGAAIMAAWDNPFTKRRMAADKALVAGIARPGGVLAMYRAYNDPAAAMTTYRSDFGAALAAPGGLGRGYVGYWETRNLRMVGNIRDVLGRYPGTRMLAIVGASHKGYYEAYLGRMHDVRLVDTAAALK